MNIGQNCKLYPEVTTPNGGVEDSRLYKDLIGKKGLGYPRPVANLLYAAYEVNGVEAAMEKVINSDGSPKYRKNRQGQFNAKDVVDFLDFDKAIGEFSTLAQEEYRIGATDSVGGSRVDFTDAEQALKIVDNFNDNHKGLVAQVMEHSTNNGTIYNIYVYEKTSKTVGLGMQTKEKLQAWDIYKQVFSNAGIDITAMPQNLKDEFSPYNDFLGQYLKNLSNMRRQDFYDVKDALTLFYLYKDSQEVKNLINSFGSIENAAQDLSDFNNGRIPLSKSQQILLTRALNYTQKLPGIDIDSLVSQIDQMKMGIQINSPEAAIKDELHKLKKKYNIEPNEVNRVNNDIRTLSDAVAEAITQLDRKVTALKKEKGNTAEGKRIEAIVNKMQTELMVHHYYTGIIDFLGEAGKDIREIDNILNNIPQTGSEKDRVFTLMKTLQRVKSIRDQYLPIVAALASDNTAMNENISTAYIDTIKQQAKDLKDLFEKYDDTVNSLTETAVHDFMKLATNGKMSEAEIHDMIHNAILQDASWQDHFLYSVGTASNPIINACGTIMLNQEILRNDAITAFRKKMDIEDSKLQEAGYNSKFMYEDQTHIVSDIDWGKYDSAKKAYKQTLYRQGLKGFDYTQKLEEWVEQNTVDRVVDKKSGRTERVPNKNYRKATDFQEGWSQAQIDYYNNVMQLKGELETLYPDHARHIYLPPQVRRSTLDALGNAKGVKDVGKAIGNKLKDNFVIREDDTSYGKRANINGEEYEIAEGNTDNTVKKRVPIWFQQRVEEGELLMDFSSALLHEAKSAINYDAMESIRDVMEFMRDFASTKERSTGNPKAEVVDNKFIRVTKALYDRATKSNTAEVLAGFMDQHLYGEIKEPGKYKWLTKFGDQIIRYTSFKGLVFNAPGATANALMGVLQIFIDAHCGEFFGYKDMAWAATKLFGNTGVKGEVMELLTNNVKHKGVLMQELFNPMQENFENDSSKRYYSSVFRKLVGHDCTYIGYSSGEYLIHMLPMYAVLHKQKVLLNGKEISLYDAFDVSPVQDGNATLILKPGVTDLNGNAITIDSDYIRKTVRGQIQYVNKTMHGAMNAEDKGMIHKYLLGRLAMNFRQWMVGYYSRRFRGRHFDYDLGDYREGYYTSLWKALMNNDTKDAWAAGEKKDAMMMFMKDFATFMFRASSQWSNLSDMQKYNIKRVRAEMLMLIALSGLSFALGDPDDHKREYWRRWWIYQVRRMLVDIEASTPSIYGIDSFLKILQSPMAGINTFNSMLYVFWGLTNGDILDEIKSGDHKGENRYIRNIIKYDLPIFKDWEILSKLDEDDSLFKVTEHTPSNR